MTRDEKFIRYAKKIAIKSEHHFQMGAIITIGNRILSVGKNKYKTHTKQFNQYTGCEANSIHAELDAILSCDNVPAKATIYVSRVLRDGSCGMAKPCKYCLEILKQYDIKRIVYSTKDGFNVQNL